MSNDAVLAAVRQIWTEDTLDRHTGKDRPCRLTTTACLNTIVLAVGKRDGTTRKYGMAVVRTDDLRTSDSGDIAMALDNAVSRAVAAWWFADSYVAAA